MSTIILIDFAYLYKSFSALHAMYNREEAQKGIDFPKLPDIFGRMVDTDRISAIHVFWSSPPKDDQYKGEAFKGIWAWFSANPTGLFRNQTFKWFMRSNYELGRTEQIERRFSMSEEDIEKVLPEFRTSLPEEIVNKIVQMLPDGAVGRQFMNVLQAPFYANDLREKVVGSLRNHQFHTTYYGQKGTDSRVCTRIMSAMADTNIDHIVLVAGDGDFAPATLDALDHGKRVTLIAASDPNLSIYYSNVYDYQANMYPNFKILLLGKQEILDMARYRSSGYLMRKQRAS